MSLQQHPGLYVAPTSSRGRGVFTAEAIEADSVIEVCPVIVLPAKDFTCIHESYLHDYYFVWEGENVTALALGYGSLYNHEENSNADYEMDFESETIRIIAQRDIAPGEEICIDYTDGQDRSTLWF